MRLHTHTKLGKLQSMWGNSSVKLMAAQLPLLLHPSINIEATRFLIFKAYLIP